MPARSDQRSTSAASLIRTDVEVTDLDAPPAANLVVDSLTGLFEAVNDAVRLS